MVGWGLIRKFFGPGPPLENAGGGRSGPAQGFNSPIRGSSHFRALRAAPQKPSVHPDQQVIGDRRGDQ